PPRLRRGERPRVHRFTSSRSRSDLLVHLLQRVAEPLRTDDPRSECCAESDDQRDGCQRTGTETLERRRQNRRGPGQGPLERDGDVLTGRDDEGGDLRPVPTEIAGEL